MQESVSMHKTLTPLRHSRMNQARLEEEVKERKQDRFQEAIRKAAQQNKNTSEELKQGLPMAYLGTVQVNKLRWGGTLKF